MANADDTALCDFIALHNILFDYVRAEVSPIDILGLDTQYMTVRSALLTVTIFDTHVHDLFLIKFNERSMFLDQVIRHYEW